MPVTTPHTVSLRADEHGRFPESHEKVPLKIKVFNLIVVVTPLIGLAVACVMLWGVAFDWVHLLILAVMYLLTGFGVTIGYHRYFTHRSFTTSRPIKALLGVLGSMAVEGPVIEWVATHRKHHQHSDTEEDPHSPHTHGETIRGALHAHIGWFILSRARSREHDRDMRSAVSARYARDLSSDPLIRWLDAMFPWLVLLSLALPALAGGLITMSWTGALLGLLWGGLVRIFLVHHVTWSINSVCHIWGTRPFDSHDESRNNAIFGVLALGEGWHNNHHAFPASARHGLKWWQFDLSYLIILVMARLGLVRDVKTPSRAHIERKLARGNAA